MKKIFLLAFAAASLAACQQTKPTEAAADSVVKTTTATTAVASPDAPVISFEKGMYNFGKIVQGESVHYEFKFTNTGKSPLIITNATATCGCTIPEIPKEPIKPGAEGVIKVVFNSAGKMGMQDKVVTITSNGNPSTTEVHLIGEVKERT
ncbi:hypothetical protein TH53_22245 [Pedobacter lusitanus]|uniref:Type IV secretion system putative lipoprotein virB7 n=1 Tax=Pedobacter lusitanus TaxID=1503925 RepID=A0A0D0GL10_9SPHI|nr:DUF1573 domain-containing protein [Pedobacter lusitanus]KIO75141.1 hypothetical protein TH53_22245 [Pedobacter lusitanus]